MMKLNVLYEDNHLIVVEKPAGMLVQADKTGDPCLMDEVKKYLKEKYKKPGNVFLGLVHRLDRPVGGVVLFAKTSKGASRISAQFREHAVEKYYYAVVVGKMEKSSGEIVSFLKKDEKKNVVEVFDHEMPGTARAELFWEVEKVGAKNSLLKIKLGTGRAHQIRAQLTSIGHPILGDLKYGASEPLPDKSIALFAASLSFHLATSDEIKTVELPWPKEWKKYL
ncbi:RNA pseudouridine synthase [Candidatus Falkowbacteria bacterium]|nr:RNA pseudouridine synthase [Candidatus Falkowbacteria bacterium]